MSKSMAHRLKIQLAGKSRDEVLNALIRTEITLDNVQKAGWRACIDHIIKPESPCPVCEIERLQSQLDAVMLEHCPEEMSVDQLAAWESRQQIAGSAPGSDECTYCDGPRRHCDPYSCRER